MILKNATPCNENLGQRWRTPWSERNTGQHLDCGLVKCEPKRESDIANASYSLRILRPNTAAAAGKKSKPVLKG